MTSYLFDGSIPCMQINLEEFADLCNAIGLRFQKEDTVCQIVLFKCMEVAYNMSYNFIMLDRQLLHCIMTLCVIVAAIYLWILSIFLPFTLFRKFEGLRTEPQIWIHSILHSDRKFCCCHHWNVGMILHLIKLTSSLWTYFCVV